MIRVSRTVPEKLDERTHPDRFPGVIEQYCDHAALLRGSERYDPSVVDQFGCAEYAEFHVRPHQRVIGPLLSVFQAGNPARDRSAMRNI